MTNFNHEHQPAANSVHGEPDWEKQFRDALQASISVSHPQDPNVSQARTGVADDTMDSSMHGEDAQDATVQMDGAETSMQNPDNSTGALNLHGTSMDAAFDMAQQAAHKELPVLYDYKGWVIGTLISLLYCPISESATYEESKDSPENVKLWAEIKRQVENPISKLWRSFWGASQYEKEFKEDIESRLKKSLPGSLMKKLAGKLYNTDTTHLYEDFQTLEVERQKEILKTDFLLAIALDNILEKDQATEVILRSGLRHQLVFHIYQALSQPIHSHLPGTRTKRHRHKLRHQELKLLALLQCEIYNHKSDFWINVEKMYDNCSDGLLYKRLFHYGAIETLEPSEFNKDGTVMERPGNMAFQFEMDDKGILHSYQAKAVRYCDGHSNLYVVSDPPLPNSHVFDYDFPGKRLRFAQLDFHANNLLNLITERPALKRDPLETVALERDPLTVLDNNHEPIG